MTTGSALDAVRRVAGPINDLGGRWLLDPATMQAGTEAGYGNPFAWYAVGRGAVLGDVDADVVTAAFGYFSPVVVRALWEEGIGVEGARAAAARYAEACAAWGRATLAGFADLDRLSDLGDRWNAAVSPCGLSLFVGWRAMTPAADSPGRAALTLQVLRELRGSVHICATTAAGLSPLEAVLSDPHGGPDRARMFGWPDPYPDTSGLADRRRAAEDVTDQVLAGHLAAALDASEQAELADLVLALRSHVDG